ncbi:MAG: glucosidase, partial [Bryobacteraceae bacterium]|nr:glucosidase [Bryobacteraceae bacterium]
MPKNAEQLRLEAAARREAHWRRWGPYLSERQWGTVREDYSPDGSAWTHFPHDHARSRVYRWGEDGIAGISDNHQRLCFAPAFWNGRDPILKERLFGLTGREGSHGEDVKEYYYYLDSTPTHSYMKCLYKYPQAEFPYDWLVQANRNRPRSAHEFELMDTGVFEENRYFDIYTEYAKADVDDILIRVTVENRGPEAAELHLLPTLWFRNTWSWKPGAPKPEMRARDASSIEVRHESLGPLVFEMDGAPAMLFTGNETNTQRLYGFGSGYFKDAFHETIIRGRKDVVNPQPRGTKACGWYHFRVPAGGSQVFRLRLYRPTEATRLVHDFDGIFAERIQEADEFYRFANPKLSEDGLRVQRQAFAGMLWSKQFYHYVVEEWLTG